VSMYTIYALVDPRDYATRYIGMSRNVYQRFIQHISCRGESAAKDAWIRELKLVNLMVIMQMLGTAETYEQAKYLEAQWIRLYHERGAALFNKTRIPASVVKATGGALVALYDGKSRHTAGQIDEILDEYLRSGDLPTYVSERQRRDYRKHPRLEDRRKLLQASEPEGRVNA
jgi:predicted GIY-YIG superfamily endonuclease